MSTVLLCIFLHVQTRVGEYSLPVVSVFAVAPLGVHAIDGAEN